MLKNYIKIALRNLSRNKLFSGINILGLAIGIATCMIIMLFVKNELSYDRFHEKADRIVRVTFQGSVQGEKMREAHVMPPVAKTLKAEYPEVQDATRLRMGGYPRISYNGKSFREDALAFADPNVFQVFTLPLIKGDPGTALKQPNTVVLSEAIAAKYFGDDEPMGKILVFKDSDEIFKVTGVMKNIPVNSHFHFDLFASMATLPETDDPSWMRSEFFTYLVLPSGYDYKQLQSKLPQVVKKHMGPQMKQAMGISLAEFEKKGNNLGLFLQPLTDIHLNADFNYDFSTAGDIRYVYIFTAIALFMLLIACINFMNLSTAGASKRAREVGIRKVLGSGKGQLVKQFLLESVLLTFIALIVAVALMRIGLPLFNDLSGKELVMPLLTDPSFLLALLMIGLLTGLVAGSYPAFFLSSMIPVAVLKGRFTGGKNSIGLRSGLVVFQFFISITLIVGTTVVYKQLQYIQNKKLGYNKDQVLIMRETGFLGRNEEVFRQQLLQDSRILNITNSGYLPAGPTNNNNFFVYPGASASRQIKTLRYDVDERYIPTLGMELVAGRNFSSRLASDSSAVILNEAAVSALGWKENVVGQTLTRADNDGEKKTYHVIGVVKDFHFRSLHERISPLVMVLGKSYGLIAKVHTADLPALLNSIKKRWTAFSQDEPFTYAFLDDRFRETYEAERKMGYTLGIFAGLTIVVACLGLFGLATFTAEQRTKEIGIRKVLGASVPDIIALLSKDFLKLVVIANLIAWPLAWLIMSKWLQEFAYRIHIGWWVFALAGFATAVIAVLTVGVRAFKAGNANPVKSLRTE